MQESSYTQWPGNDDRSVVAEMLADLHSPHWKECSSYVERYIFGKFPLLPEHLQHEAVQDAMLSVHRGLKEFRYESKLTTWLVPIAHNRAIDLYRKFKLEVQSEIPQKNDLNESDDEEDLFRTDVSSSPIEILLIMEELEEVKITIEKYIGQHGNRERNRRIIAMVLFEKRTREETARILGLNAPVVSYVVREARKFLKEKFPGRSWHHPQLPDDLDQ